MRSEKGEIEKWENVNLVEELKYHKAMWDRFLSGTGT